MLILRRKPVSQINVQSLVRRRTMVSQQAAGTDSTKRVLRLTTSTNAATRAAAAASAREEVNSLLQSVATVEATLDQAAAELEMLHKQIEEKMRSANINEHSDGHYKTAIEAAFSRQSRTIDPKKFRNAVGDAAFWGSIDVGVTKAKQYMSERELDAISEVVPPKSLGYVFKIKKIERKVK